MESMGPLAAKAIRDLGSGEYQTVPSRYERAACGRSPYLKPRAPRSDAGNIPACGPRLSAISFPKLAKSGARSRAPIRKSPSLAGISGVAGVKSQCGGLVGWGGKDSNPEMANYLRI